MSGSAPVGADENKKTGGFSVSTGDRKMYIIKYTYGSVTAYNHYVLGHQPFAYVNYRRWLTILANTDSRLDKHTK